MPIEKNCADCLATFIGAGRQLRCPPCQKQSLKTRRNTPQARIQYQAQLAARNAVSRGTLIKAPCEVCGTDRVHAHHDDYSKPLEVRWLCPLHHRHIHIHGCPLGSEYRAWRERHGKLFYWEK